jgi:protein SCO1/2
MADVASALRRVEPSVRSRAEVVFVTTDPERDTAPVIREWLDRFDPSFTGLTATLPTIERAAAGLGVAMTGKEPATGGGYEVGHGTQLIGFGPDGKGRVVWVEGTPVGGLRADISRLAAG